MLTDRYLSGITPSSRMAKDWSLKKDTLTPELLRQLKEWNAQAQALGQSLAEKALRWVLAHKGVTSVLIGASSVKQLETNLRCVN